MIRFFVILVKKSHKEEEKSNAEEGKNEAENDDPDKRFVIMPGTISYQQVNSLFHIILLHCFSLGSSIS